METNDREHETNTYVSFDSPHRKANIPLGLQYWLKFHSVESSSAELYTNRINSPAARQMLAYHFTTSNNETPLSTSESVSFYNELRGESGALDRAYPRENGMWKVGIANGSGYGNLQRGRDGHKMFPGENSKLIHTDIGKQRIIHQAIDADAWAVPIANNRTTIFWSNDNILGNGQDYLHRVIDDDSSEPYDNAPGGYRGTAQQIIDQAQSELDGNDEARTDYPRHAFVPTVSALDVTHQDGDPSLLYNLNFHNIPNKTPLPEDQDDVRTPFDIVRYSTGGNEPHVFPDNIGSFLIGQVGQAPARRVVKGETISTEKPILRSRNETVARDVTLEDGADVILASGGTVRLGPGFEVEKGAKLKVSTDPALSEPPTSFRMDSAPSVAAVSSESTTAAGATKERKGDADAPSEEAAGKTNVPDTFRLSANYPNPFRTSTEIRFDLPEAADVSLVVYDMLGRRVATLTDGRKPAGYHHVRLEQSQLSAGTYLYRLTTGSFAKTKRLVVVR
jgi:hypothetical protein